MRPRRSTRALLVHALFFVAIGCGPASEPEPYDPVDVSAIPEHGDPRPHLAHCVLHAGSVNGRTSASGEVEASCTFDAECIEHVGQGGESPTDGFISLSCEGLRCSCSVERIGDHATTFREEFAIEDPCIDANIMRGIFLEHCMTGSELEPEDDGATSGGAVE
ncbi:MAG: hypothetical protein AB7S26_03205 [Sandaracinaceae bacterium]